MRKAMLDTMVFDALSADQAGLDAVLDAVRHGHLLLVTTHVQEDQLAAIKDAVKRKALQRIPRRVLPTSVLIAGVSRTGRARLGPGSEYDALRHASKHAEDEIITDTTAARADVLVTEDKRLIADAQSRGLTVWRTAELIAWARRAAVDR
jgi:predicted nucleic acid-binding protein